MNEHPSTPRLLKATAGAAALAAVVLVVAVLPAEFGIDPTGLGTRMGLTALRAEPAAAPPAEMPDVPASPEPATATAQAAAQAVIRQAAPFRSQEMSLTLQPQQGAEIKAATSADSGFVFSWTASGPVNFDMHGERPNAGAEFTSYWKDRQQTSGHGSFVAPFEGTHGWFWRNRGDKPVTVTVRVAGFFERLYHAH